MNDTAQQFNNKYYVSYDLWRTIEPDIKPACGIISTSHDMDTEEGLVAFIDALQQELSATVRINFWKKLDDKPRLLSTPTH
jgi:hypothetical protein